MTWPVEFQTSIFMFNLFSEKLCLKLTTKLLHHTLVPLNSPTFMLKVGNNFASIALIRLPIPRNRPFSAMLDQKTSQAQRKGQTKKADNSNNVSKFIPNQKSICKGFC